MRRVTTTRRIAISSDNHPGMARELDVSAEPVFGLEIEVALNRQAELAAHVLDLAEHQVAEFGTAHAKVTQAEQANVLAFGTGFRDEPCRSTIRREQLHDRERIEAVTLLAGAAILDQLVQQFVGDQPSVRGKRAIMTPSPLPVR